MLGCSASLWSADLGNLASEIKRVEPYSERFHLDVVDGHYVPSMLFCVSGWDRYLGNGSASS
jgi:pentose-5-phosphate-3-epimerase